MATLQGTYRAKKDDQTYTYEVTWRPGGEILPWDAKVRLGPQLIGLPSGQVHVRPGNSLDEIVRRDVEYAIEHRLSLE